MGILGTSASSFADMTLIAQAAGFLILYSGVAYARRKNFLKHDEMAKIAVFLGGLSFIWMGYSLVSNFLALISITPAGLLVASHAVTGLLALFMGIFLVFDEIKKTTTSMRLVFSMWTIAMLLGVILYIVVYVSL